MLYIYDEYVDKNEEWRMGMELAQIILDGDLIKYNWIYKFKIL